MSDYKEMICLLRNLENIGDMPIGKHWGVIVDNLTIKNATDMITELRNELCYRCGQYAEAHNGACDSCKWRDG